MDKLNLIQRRNSFLILTLLSSVYYQHNDFLVSLTRNRPIRYKRDLILTIHDTQCIVELRDTRFKLNWTISSQLETNQKKTKMSLWKTTI